MKEVGEKTSGEVNWCWWRCWVCIRAQGISDIEVELELELDVVAEGLCSSCWRRGLGFGDFDVVILFFFDDVRRVRLTAEE